MFRRLVNTNNDGAIAVVRLVLGIVMFAHGSQKMLGWFGGAGFSGTMGGFTQTGMPAVVAFLVICAEFFGSLALILGFLGRIGAVAIAAVMLGAISLVHLKNGLFMNWTGQQAGEGFEYHLLALGMSVLIMLRGSGAFSIDRMLTRRPPGEAARHELPHAA